MSIPTLNGERKWIWFFVYVEVDWVVVTPQPVKPTEPIRDEKDDDSILEKKEEGLYSAGDVLHPRKHKVANRQ